MYSELHMCLCPIVWLTDVWIMMPLMTSYLQAVCRRFHGGCCSDLVLHRTGTSQSATDSYHGLFWNTHIHSERTTWLPNSSGNFLILTQCLMLKRYCLCDPCERITVFFHLRCGAILWHRTRHTPFFARLKTYFVPLFPMGRVCLPVTTSRDGISRATEITQFVAFRTLSVTHLIIYPVLPSRIILQSYLLTSPLIRSVKRFRNTKVIRVMLRSFRDFTDLPGHQSL